jgi:hypothetical protein
VSDPLQAMGFRFRKHDRVYLLGSAEPLVVLGQLYITRIMEPYEERQYCLRSRQGDEIWIDACHVYGVPTRSVPA